MFIVDKKTLHSTYVAATKLIGKFTEIIIEVVPEGLWLTINVESYIRVFVPAEEVAETGIFKIQQEVFQSVFNLRGDKLKCSFNKEQNILNVVAGTRVSLYVSFKVSKEEYEQPEIPQDTNQIQLESYQIAEFKTKLNRIHFTSPDLNTHEYALVKNSKKRTSLTFATTNICTRYKMESLLGNESFELTIPIDKFRLALSMIDSEMSVIITDNFLLLESDTLIVTLPALLDTQFLGFIESCDELMKNEALVSGSIQFDISKIQKMLASVRSISQGSNVIDFKLKGTEMIISLESKIGVTKDKVKINENTIDDNLKFAIPELFMNAALAMSQFINDTVNMQFGDGYRYFLITAENDGIDFFTLGPVAEE